MNDYFQKNIGTISTDEQEILHRCSVFVAGCGGLGGYVCEYLSRSGIGSLIIADDDMVSVSDINRQIIADSGSVGSLKTHVLRDRLCRISPGLHIEEHTCRLEAGNAVSLLRGCDLVLDCLDNTESRFVLADACKENGISMIHGAISGFCCQIGIVSPGNSLLKRLYPDYTPQTGSVPIESRLPDSCLSFTPGLCAAIQSAEAVKLLLGRGSNLTDRILAVDLEQNIFRICDI